MSEMIQFPRLFRFRGIDVLHNATVYLKNEFRMDMSRDEADTNLQGRALLINLQNKIMDEISIEEQI